MSSPEFLSQIRPAEVLREAILRHVRYTLVRPTSELKPADYLKPVSLAIRDRIVDRMLETESRYRHKNSKRLYYLCMEFLMGRSLGDNISNLRLEELCREVLASFGISLDEVLDSENDAGLGNGGLGRLAACFLESMATLGMPGFGYGIDYEYGLFKQEIFNGFQREKPDRWKANGTPFQIEHPEEAVNIPLYGRVEGPREVEHSLEQTWSNQKIVVGIPTDMPIVGYLGQTVNWLRLFTARASEEFDIEIFNRGDYIRAVEQKIQSENISRVLYPSDSVMSGKELRLVQEYFLVACAMGDIMRRFRQQHSKIELLPSKVAIQMNDTHPSLAVPELMRILLDEERLPWEQAWEITGQTLAYTNHTLLPEALEKWSVPLLEKVLPRHMLIIFNINHELLRQMRQYSFLDEEKLRRMSIIEEGYEKQVRMAHLCIAGSHAVNGVSKLHTDLIVHSLAPEFAQVWPERFTNKTNGVAPRRWLMKANEGLTDLISRTLDDNRWITDLRKLRDLEPFAYDPEFRQSFREVKRQNKLKLAGITQDLTGVSIDPDSMFDVQTKRIHEYKRQLLNVMGIIHDYLGIVERGEMPRVPRTYIFAGKAAPGYWAAKQIIKLIHSVADVVNNDEKARDVMKIAFLPDYRVSLAQLIIPAAELSEQISMAGMEASGTGNMKLAMNGALTIGTWDGANIEIAEEVGADNIYIFGLRAEEIRDMQQKALYNSREHYERDPAIREVMDALASDRFCPNEHGLFRWIFDELIHRGDRYFHIADFPGYVEAQQLIDGEYLDEDVWWRKAVLNVARIGRFSSDRCVTEYARDIWQIGAFEKSIRPAKPVVRSTAPVSKPDGEAVPAAETAPQTEEKHVAD
ncbi:MAG TPA: glycogen/starch/alpha-glucan phosphorylase [Candidatus Binatia bacterium]|nr:glycogen/starch/alpha-glucan phosphorylase [Candidatus Binatia bacterium]